MEPTNVTDIQTDGISPAQSLCRFVTHRPQKNNIIWLTYYIVDVFMFAMQLTMTITIFSDMMLLLTWTMLPTSTVLWCHSTLRQVDY